MKKTNYAFIAATAALTSVFVMGQSSGPLEIRRGAGVGSVNNGLATNLSVYSSGTTNRALRVFGVLDATVVSNSDPITLRNAAGTALVTVPHLANSEWVALANLQVGTVGAVTINASSLALAVQTGPPGALSVAGIWNAAFQLAAVTINPTITLAGATSYLLDVSSNSVSMLRIPISGNVGIGTTTPGAKLDVAGSVIIGVGGAAITKVLTATIGFNFDLTGVVVDDGVVTVTGAALGDIVTLGVPNESVTATVQYSAWVSAADTVKVRARTAAVGENPAAGTFRVTVIKH